MRNRYASQRMLVLLLMKDGRWRDLREICEKTGYWSAASVSARLRDLRKNKYGRHTVVVRHLQGNIWEYRVIVRKQEKNGK